MRGKTCIRTLAGLLAAVTLMQCGLPMSAMAAGSGSVETTTQVVAQAEPQLQNGAAVIPANATEEQVKELLCQALVANADQVDAQSLEWEYYCTGKNGLLTNDAWGSVNGFTSETKWGLITTTYTHPALQTNKDGNYQVRLKDSADEVTLTKAAKLSSSIVLNEDCCQVALPYNEDTTVNYDALRQGIFNTVVASTQPQLTLEDVTIEYYHKGLTALDSKWLPLEGQTIVGGVSYPAISVGEQKIRISYAENDNYYGTSAETTVTITERPDAPYTLKETPDAVTLAVGEDMKVDYALLHEAIFNAVVASSEVLTAENVTIEYYHKGLTSVDSKWLPLEGQAPTTIEATLTVKDREQVQFNLNEGPYEVGMVFTDDQGYDYTATAAAIYNAVVASTVNPQGLTAEEVTVEYNVDKTGITDTFKPLHETDLTGLVKFGTGTWEIRISWPGNQQFRGNSVTVNVTTTDSRLESVVALKEGVSFTYNMDVSAMEQAIFDNAIDWDNSTLPARETLSIEDFTIEYKAKLTDAETGLNVDLGGLLEKFPGLGDLISGDALTQWVPIEGKVYAIGGTVLGQFPQMGAGENQQIRISYQGNADYRPSEFAQGTVTVNKAGIYLDLPERYTDNSLIIQAIDKVLEGLGQKTLTQMMNDGITVGELRALFNTQGVLDALHALGINTGTFGQILEVINKLPGILDSVRISFGTPNRAGLYTVAAVTDSKNYETGVGMGFLLVKMRLSGSKLIWNQEITGKLTAEQAKTFDFGATLTYNGDVTVDQSSVHYLYTGFTTSWKLYSSTTPPTEPGSYVVTVCVLGGNYLAAPATRTFQITK